MVAAREKHHQAHQSGQSSLVRSESPEEHPWVRPIKSNAWFLCRTLLLRLLHVIHSLLPAPCACFVRWDHLQPFSVAHSLSDGCMPTASMHGPTCRVNRHTCSWGMHVLWASGLRRWVKRRWQDLLSIQSFALLWQTWLDLSRGNQWKSRVTGVHKRMRRIISFQYLLWRFHLCGLKWIT